ncbi:MAG: Ribosomal RNA large subunit methyltransferase H [Chlamydiia bacterium]|nr:Ribosomal RNA large subunit methyltransferase H [Chlamydiia bacterium]
MIKIRIYSIGKNKEPWLTEALTLYTTRLRGKVQIEFHLFRKDEELNRAIEKEKGIIGLDPKGKMQTSREFSCFLLSTIETHHSSLAFVIGGPEGLTEVVKERANHLISFSPMTFTHQMVRLILLEQIYRGFEIDKGSGYHK